MMSDKEWDDIVKRLDGAPAICVARERRGTGDGKTPKNAMTLAEAYEASTGVESIVFCECGTYNWP
jgi:hypothetical protein